MVNAMLTRKCNMFKLCAFRSHRGSVYNKDGTRAGCGFVEEHCVFRGEIGFFKCRIPGACKGYQPSRSWKEIMDKLNDKQN